MEAVEDWRGACAAVRATVNAIVAQLDDFDRVVSFGTAEEKKMFLRAWVKQVMLEPVERTAVVDGAALPGS